MAKKKKICVVTGSRAEYGILKSVMQEIQKSKNIELALVASGMHLSKAYGETIKEIQKDGFTVDATVAMTPSADSLSAMAASVGVGIEGMVKAFQKIKPDVVVVLGDRTEALAGAIAASYMTIPVAHIHGGDRSGGLDEQARHAITKFAHIHFAATKKSAERILRMGEQKNRVHMVGAPGLDELLHTKKIGKEELFKKYGLTMHKPLVLVVQHSVTTEASEAKKQMTETLDAVTKLALQALVLYPNSDAGGREIVEVIESYAKKNPLLKIQRNLPRIDYIGFLQHASVLVGNSSSGIIEAPSLGLPVVNIGLRQHGREQGSGMINVPHQKASIVKAINKALKVRKKISGGSIKEYGNGNASKKIAKILKGLTIDSTLLAKELTY
jgi:GDP/UDP-N,N'-diacetylbacillosamine 2-epimerase (hydrolysing)